MKAPLASQHSSCALVTVPPPYPTCHPIQPIAPCRDTRASMRKCASLWPGEGGPAPLLVCGILGSGSPQSFPFCTHPAPRHPAQC